MKNLNFLLLFIGALSSFSCRNLQNQGANHQVTRTESTLSPTPQTSTTPAEIRIGFIAPLTGGGAAWGIPSQRAAQFAVEDLSSRAREQGLTLRLVADDDRGRTEEAPTTALRLASSVGAHFIVGAETSGCAIPVGNILEAEKLIYLVAGASNPNVTRSREYTFRVGFEDNAQAQLIASYLHQNFPHLRRVGILQQADSVYAGGLSTIFQQRYRALGGQIIEPVQMFRGTDTEMSAQTTNLVYAGAEAIFLATQDASSASIAAQNARGHGFALVRDRSGRPYTGFFFGGDSWGSDLTQWIQRDLFLEGSFFTDGYAPELVHTDAHTAFIERLQRANHGFAPSAPAVYAYEATRLGIEVMLDLVQSNSQVSQFLLHPETLSNRAQISAAKLVLARAMKAQFLSGREFQGLIEPIRFGQDHETIGRSMYTFSVDSPLENRHLDNRRVDVQPLGVARR